MGRISYPQEPKAANRSHNLWSGTIKLWIVPFGLAVGVMLAVHFSVRADYVPDATQLAQYVQQHDLDVYLETSGGYQQVFYKFGGHNIQVTDEGYNHRSVATAGQYLVWQDELSGYSQITLYDVVNKTSLQLANSGLNERPSLNKNGIVTWQVWDGDYWQVMYYNGQVVQQLTNDDEHSSTNPVTDGDKIIYTVQLSTDHWRARAYDIQDKSFSTLAEGDTASTAYPHISPSGTITTNYTIPQ